MAYQGPVQINPELTHGFRAEVSLAELSEDELFAALAEQPVPLVLAVDQITDTRNLGAIARSAAFFGVPYLIMPRDRQAAITSASLAAAQGGFAYVSPIWVTNLSRCLRRLKDEAAYWVFGADMAGEAFAPGQLDHDRMVLVMGREDRGLRPLTKKTCDHLIGIAGAERRVESLNVAVATGICLHQLRAGIISQ
jgi:23S rRNA (guanosine2251-2'-O)-methyltransferase